MKALSPLTLLRAALLPLSLLALSCGGGGNGNQKDPPQAILTVPKPNVAGPKITILVGATGCDSIHSLEIYDRTDFLKAVPYSGPGTVPVDLTASEVKYTRGIAVNMSLKAKVTCTDGRSNESQPQPATFFPAAEVIDPPNAGGQVVTDNFVTEGRLPLIYFIGCGNDPSRGGQPFLYKVEKNNGLVKSVAMPFICNTSTVITPKHPSTGKRWVWTPNAGAIAIDSELNITGRINVPIDILVPGVDGDAIAYDVGSAGSPAGVVRASHQTGSIKWAYSPRGFLITAPVARTDDVLIAVISGDNAPSGRANIIVRRVDYGQQDPSRGGAELGNFLIKEVASAGPIVTEAPPTAFSPDGNLLYMSFTAQGGITQVLACVTNGDGCEGPTQRWTTPPTLNAPIGALVPYAGGTRLAAIGAQQAWFIDTSTGGVTNKGGAGLASEGGLVILQVQSGAPPNAQAFYLLSGPPPQAGLPAPQPLEIVATDDPAKGELYRYQINAGSISVAMDESGTLWMRAGGSLVRPLTLNEYRQVRPVTP
jgi:hypothetical protein